MGLEELAKRIADTGRLGMSQPVAEHLKVPTADTARGQLMAMSDGGRGPLAVYLVAMYVIDDTDFFGAGEIYWWSVPVLLDGAGNARWGAAMGLPAGAPPHKCGSLEWMTNLPLENLPLLAVLPVGDDSSASVIRFAVYDDDGKPAELGPAMAKGYEALSLCKREGLHGAGQIITPVRDAIMKALVAAEDDVLIDEDITIPLGAKGDLQVGFVASAISAKVRVYYVLVDEQRTDTAGPIMLKKDGDEARLLFASTLERGGRVSIFARGADVRSEVFGVLTVEQPFKGKVLDDDLAKRLNTGIEITAKGAAKVIAFYTPP
jgi:hypothetical protein